MLGGVCRRQSLKSYQGTGKKMEEADHMEEAMEADVERLLQAAHNGDLESLRALIESGVDVNCVHMIDGTALHEAVRWKYLSDGVP